MKLTKIWSALAVAAVALVAVSVTRADSLPDGRGGVGTSGPGSPPCSQFSIPLVGGAIPVGTQCTEGANTTTISLFSSGPNPLVVYSPLLENPTVDSGPNISKVNAELAAMDLVWSVSCGATTIGGAAAQECTLTAPTPTAADMTFLAGLAAKGQINDGDCDRDDTILFVPGPHGSTPGCDVFFTTGAIGNLPGDVAGQFFAPGQQLQSTSNGAAPIPFAVPEPGSLALVFVGFGGLAAFRRRLAN